MINTASNLYPESDENYSFIHYNGSLAYKERYEEIDICKIFDGNGRPLPNDFFSDSEHAENLRIVLLTTDNKNYFYYGSLSKTYFSFYFENSTCVNAKIYYFYGINIDLLISGLKLVQVNNYHFLDIANLYNKILALKLHSDVLAELIAVSPAFVSNRKRLLALSPEVKKIIKSHKITERFSRVICSVKNPKVQLHFLNVAIRNDLSANKLEIVIRKFPPKMKHLSENEQIKIIDNIISCFCGDYKMWKVSLYSQIEKIVSDYKRKYKANIIFRKSETLTDNLIIIQIPKDI